MAAILSRRRWVKILLLDIYRTWKNFTVTTSVHVLVPNKAMPSAGTLMKTRLHTFFEISLAICDFGPPAFWIRFETVAEICHKISWHFDRWYITCSSWTDYHGTTSLIARFVGPMWGPSEADRTQVGPMLAPWTLLSGMPLGFWNCLFMTRYRILPHFEC